MSKKSEEEASDAVLAYLNKQNRPYSVVDIFSNLHKEYGKTAIQRSVEKLASKGIITEKINGKQKVYAPKQDQFGDYDENEIKKIDENIKISTGKLKQLQETLKTQESACKDNLKSCMTSASGFKAKALCFKQFAICLKNKGPSSDVAMDVSYDDGEPDRHPYVQCKIDLYDCVQAGTPKLECLNKYKSCMAAMLPTIPPHVIACNAEFKQCLKDSWLLGKALCFTELGKCLVRPIPIPAFLQCKIDLVNCFKDGQKDKLECAKDYTGCLSALIPTISPPVKQCFATFEQCSYKAGGIFDLYRCIKAVGICVNNGGPTTQLPL